MFEDFDWGSVISRLSSEEGVEQELVGSVVKQMLALGLWNEGSNGIAASWSFCTSISWCTFL
jgi:hypothetical protein